MTKMNERTREIAHELFDVVLDTSGAAEIEALVALLPGEAREKLSDLLAPMVQTMVVGDVAYSTAVKGWDGRASDVTPTRAEAVEHERNMSIGKLVGKTGCTAIEAAAFVDSLDDFAHTAWMQAKWAKQLEQFRMWTGKAEVTQ